MKNYILVFLYLTVIQKSVFYNNKCDEYEIIMLLNCDNINSVYFIFIDNKYLTEQMILI